MRRPPAARRVVWLNGRLVHADRARVCVLDRGLLYGDGLFETLRAYRGRPLALEEHLARLARSARVLALPLPSPKTWQEAIAKVLAGCGLEGEDAAVRLTVTRGVGGSGPTPPPRPRPTLLVHARPIDPLLARRQARGVAVCLLPAWLGRALPAHKTLCYLPGVLARRFAHRRRCSEALHVNGRGEVLEGASSTIFAVLGSAIATPPLDAGVLPGVTRALVLELARTLGLTVEERALRVDELTRVREVFLASSVVEILPVVRLSGKPVSGGRPGPVTRRLQAAYRAHVEATLGLHGPGATGTYPAHRRRTRA